MRISCAIMLGIVSALATTAAIWFSNANGDGTQLRPAILHARRDGAAAAQDDIAAGTPWVRRLLASAPGDVGTDGMGVDRATGLPLCNTFLSCGTGVDFEAYRAENKAYEARPNLLSSTFADGPMEVWIVDGDTTELVRDRDKYVWVIDLARAFVLQVTGPVD